MIVDRRALLGGMTALSLPMPVPARPGSLGALAAAKGIRFGSTIGLRNFRDRAYRDLNARECALVVPGTDR